jgi:hypothetical protein
MNLKNCFLVYGNEREVKTMSARDIVKKDPADFTYFGKLYGLTTVSILVPKGAATGV